MTAPGPEPDEVPGLERGGSDVELRARSYRDFGRARPLGPHPPGLPREPKQQMY